MPNSNGRHRSHPKGRKPKQAEKPLDSRGRDNDPNWYFSSTELATQAAELSFQNMLGAGPVISQYNVPGIMVFRMNPCPGISYQIPNAAQSLPTDAQVSDGSSCNVPNNLITHTKDGINLMSTKIYSMLSTYSGRTSSYGPQDIAIMNLSIGEVASLVEHIRRCFGVAMTYNPRNRFLPLGLLNAMSIDGQDLIQNLANYRMRFNVAIARINQIPILDNIGYIRKCRDMYQHIYIDDTSAMSQIYFYVPNQTWVLEETPSPNDWSYGSILKSAQVSQVGTTSTIASLLTLLESMIDKLLFSSTLNIVYADLMNLANRTNVPFTSFDYLAENYVVMPEFNRNANLQMHNLTIIGEPSSYAPSRVIYPFDNAWWDSKVKADYGMSSAPFGGGCVVFTPLNNVYADVQTNSIIYNPYFEVPFTNKSQNPWYSGLNIVDMDIDNPSLEDRIEALRFKCMESGYYRPMVQDSAVTKTMFFKIFPTLPDHYCTGAVIFSTMSDQGHVISHSIMDGGVPASSSTKLSQLQNHPLIYAKNNQDYVNNTVYGILGDLTFFTTIDYDYLNRLNRLISTGLFDFRV